MRNNQVWKMEMKLLLPVAALFLLTGCGLRQEMVDGNAETVRKQALDQKLNREIDQRGYAQVGVLPDGRALYLKEVDIGWDVDRIYFTLDSKIATVAKRDCGKNCVTKAVTVED